MNHNIFRYIFALALACVTTTADAQSFDGIYQPTGSSWTCSPDQIGMDGGSLAIRNGVFDGVENRCNLTNPIPTNGGTRFTAVCSAEGSTYSELMTITTTSTGVSIERNGFTSSWSRCNDRQAATAPVVRPRNGAWTFSGGQGVYESATRDDQGNSITFTCNDLGENGGLYVELGGQPISGGHVSFDVDGTTFGMTAWADGGRINTECSVCGDNYMSLWNATAAGNLVTVTASDGRTAAFSLVGSSNALGEVACRPDSGF